MKSIKEKRTDKYRSGENTKAKQETDMEHVLIVIARYQYLDILRRVA